MSSEQPQELVALSGQYSQEIAHAETAEGLVAIWRRLQATGVQVFCLIAQCVARAAELGIVLPGLTAPQRRMYLGIAGGVIDADAYHRFRGTRIQGQLPNLPIPEQQRLGAGGHVKVWSFADGVPACREVDPFELDSLEQRQVFGGQHGIRNCAEQRSWIEAQRKSRATRPVAEITIDRRRKTVRIPPSETVTELTCRQLAQYMAQLA